LDGKGKVNLGLGIYFFVVPRKRLKSAMAEKKLIFERIPIRIKKNLTKD
jgi:hypothetical protein